MKCCEESVCHMNQLNAKFTHPRLYPFFIAKCILVVNITIGSLVAKTAQLLKTEFNEKVILNVSSELL